LNGIKQTFRQQEVLSGIAGPHDFIADAAAFGLAANLISLVALGASYLPARKAANGSPMEALREQ
jgi:ABC-type lipoprotein release transport system permease subunit